MRLHMHVKYSTQRSVRISYEAKNSYWSRDSKAKALVYSASKGNEMKGTLFVFSLVNQMLEPLGNIRIGRFMSSGKDMAHAATT